jgi:hypothetical protein
MSRLSAEAGTAATARPQMATNDDMHVAARMTPSFELPLGMPAIDALAIGLPEVKVKRAS